MLGVAPDKLKAFPQLKQSALTPAVKEINALSDFNVEVEPVRQGGQQRGTLTGFRVSWETKEPGVWSEVLSELMNSKVGRKARLECTVESVASVLSH